MRSLAQKAKPFDSIVTTEWRKLCIGELLGYRLRMDGKGSRRPIVEGGHSVPIPSGGYGNVLDQQPEADALLRWSCGKWTASDAKYSEEWRRLTKSLDLESFRRRFGPTRQRADTPAQLQGMVSLLLNDPSLQQFFLSLLVEEITADRDLQRRLLRKWAGKRQWPSHATYSRFCIKTLLTFYLALNSGLVGTRATNRVDLEYLFYLPFAAIFVSGDEGSHGRLAPILIESDQTFVRADDFRNALHIEKDRIAALMASGVRPGDDALEPPIDSLIRELWMRAWGKFRTPPSERQPLPDDSNRVGTIAEEFKRAMDHVNAHPEIYPKRKPWPS